ncbi:hypothetical protein V6N13_020382 [Hibiscus sabdariffa]|uniref:Uncharacterized protein n=1 Tax=Hibiscus sabdariffa TaxID=183260 RepID=A0ABR2ETA8_9ROSI
METTFMALDSVHQGKPMVEVERIAVQIITEAHAASLQPRSLSLRPLRFHLPNKLFQHTSWPSLWTHKFDTIPMVCHFLFQLISLQDLQNLPMLAMLKQRWDMCIYSFK